MNLRSEIERVIDKALIAGLSRSAIIDLLDEAAEGLQSELVAITEEAEEQTA